MPYSGHRQRVWELSRELASGLDRLDGAEIARLQPSSGIAHVSLGSRHPVLPPRSMSGDAKGHLTAGVPSRTNPTFCRSHGKPSLSRTIPRKTGEGTGRTPKTPASTCFGKQKADGQCATRPSDTHTIHPVRRVNFYFGGSLSRIVTNLQVNGRVEACRPLGLGARQRRADVAERIDPRVDLGLGDRSARRRFVLHFGTSGGAFRLGCSEGSRGFPGPCCPVSRQPSDAGSAPVDELRGTGSPRGSARRRSRGLPCHWGTRQRSASQRRRHPHR